MQFIDDWKATRRKETVTPMSNWISVKDRLPEPHVDVLTYRAKNGYMEISHRLRSRWWCERESNKVTHWMPLPEPPER